jgi:transcriptional regulator with XRE-family HTH domain
VERNTVSRWENGGMLPKDPAIIAALAQVLRVSADWLLGGLVAPVAEPSTDVLLEHPDHPYGQKSLVEALPPGADDLVFRYLERLLSLGCSRAQVQEAERLLVELAQHNLSPRPFSQRDTNEIRDDIDSAWDFVTQVLRRQGIRP